MRRVKIATKQRCGFTLVELLTVIFISSVLAAVATPIMFSRINSAKWSEGKAMAGTIASAIRTWVAGSDEKGLWTEQELPAAKLGIQDKDLKGTYFNKDSFEWQVDYDGIDLVYVITINKPDEIGSPEKIMLDSTGNWSE